MCGGLNNTNNNGSLSFMEIIKMISFGQLYHCLVFFLLFSGSENKNKTKKQDKKFLMKIKEENT